MSVVLALLLGLLCPASGGGPRTAGAGDDPLPMEVRVPRMDTAEAQLAHARGVKRCMLQRPAEQRDFWRRLAIDAYRAVPYYHPDDRALGAEALFRGGELARAGGLDDEAAELFAKARDLGGGTPFRARAGLELGHLHRRAGRRREALDAYLAVAADARALPGQRDDAWLWAGKVWSAMGRIDDARSAWRRVAEHGDDPVDRVEAYDELALSRVEEGDLEAAAGVLDECLRELSDLALEETEGGLAVRKALARMRALDALEDAVRRRFDERAEHGGEERGASTERSGGESAERSSAGSGLKAGGRSSENSLDKMKRLFHRLLPIR